MLPANTVSNSNTGGRSWNTKCSLSKFIDGMLPANTVSNSNSILGASVSMIVSMSNTGGKAFVIKCSTSISTVEDANSSLKVAAPVDKGALNISVI